MDYRGFPFTSGAGPGPVPFPVSSDGKSSVIGDIPMYANTTGQLITDSGVLASNVMLKSGSTMTGDLNMNGHNILNVEFPLSIENVTISSPSLVIPLDPDVDLISIDSRASIGVVSLGAPAVNSMITIQLAYQASYAVTIQTSQGNLEINSSIPVYKLAYYGTQWVVIGSCNTLGSFPPQRTITTKLTPSGFVGSSGTTGVNDLSISADGLYICYGSSNDDTKNGSVYIWFYNGVAWSQQARLQGSGAVGPGQQGNAAKLNSNAVYLAEGATHDNSDVGAVWVFQRTGSSWAQMGSKLTPSGTIGGSLFFGASLVFDSGALLLFVGCPGDNGGEGSVIIFSRSGSTWTQIQRISGSTAGTDITAGFGSVVCCSCDGHWLYVSAPYDGSGSIGDDTGAICVFYSSDLTTWTQVGSKFRAPVVTPGAFFGENMGCNGNGTLLCVSESYLATNQGQNDYYSIQNGVPSFLTTIIGTFTNPSTQAINTPGISADGSFTVIGGPTDASLTGSIWFTQNLGPGYQQVGASIHVTGEIGPAQVGLVNACSNNGSVVCSTGLADNGGIGAVWVFQ